MTVEATLTDVQICVRLYNTHTHTHTHKITYNDIQVCFEGNPDLQRAFNGSFYRPGEGGENGSDWTAPPTCIIGIPGITRTQTILGG